MSSKIRSKIAYWFVLVLGIFLLCTQAGGYFLGKIELTAKELVVFALGIAMVLNPSVLTYAMRTYVKSKLNDKKNDDKV